MGMRFRLGALVDGRQLKAARIILDLSQAEVAEMAGLHRNSVYRVENMKALPRHCHAGDRIMEALAPRGITFDRDCEGEAVVRFKLAR